MKKIYLLLFVTAVTLLNAQITVTPGGAATALAQAIVGNGISVSNAVLNCGSVSYGLFGNGNIGSGNIGLANGVLLTTGRAVDVPGTATTQINYDSNLGGYIGSNASDLNLMTISPTATLNTCKLEFDLI